MSGRRDTRPVRLEQRHRQQRIHLQDRDARRLLRSRRAVQNRRRRDVHRGHGEHGAELQFAYPADIAAILRYSTYDVSEVHTYSDIDSTAWDATLRAEAKLTAKLSGTASYQYIDYTDNSPYLDDLTGSLEIVQVGLRWKF